MASGPAGQAAARALVEKIADDHGHIPADIFAEMSERAREAVFKSMRNKDQLISSSVNTLAKNVYTSKARFVYELLQNADDNRYTRCKTSGNAPFIRFSIYHKRIVVDCNEDGFTPENLHAICNIGKSSKKGAQGYIGEKGIGFKSVFMVAAKVDIQSCDFSFFFNPRPDDPGVGMISPEWQEATNILPCDTTTRITLHLHDKEGDGPPEMILQQFEDLQETMLLFFKNIRRVIVSLYDQDEKVKSETIYSSSTSDQYSRLTKKITGTSAGDQVSFINYHITRHTATNLAPNENRDYSQTEVGERAYAKSEVVLAFPLTPDDEPILEKQHIYAFLPVRKEGFEFLIQADWVTQANRQGIVVTSQRNIDLVQGVVEAFAKAATEFCQHEKLRYTWMRFLPHLKVYQCDDFWKELAQRIISKIQEVPVIVPFNDGPLRLIASSRRFTRVDLDKNDDPLLEDISPTIYLSKQYRNSDLDQLSQCNLKYVNMEQTVDRLRADLARSSSKVRSSATDEDWHNRLAQTLLVCWEKGWIVRQEEIKQLELLPIGGKWLSASSTVPHLHFPTSDGIKIPTDLGLHLLNADKLTSTGIKELYRALGATEASEHDIKSLIRQKHTPPVVLNHTNIKSHVEFLYMTHRKEMNPATYSHIYLGVANDQFLYRPQRHDVYFLDPQPYSPKELIGLDLKDDEGKVLALFLHNTLTASTLCASASGHSLSWSEFLHSFMGVRHRLRLTRRSSPGTTVSLTPACNYIRQHKAQKFVGLLQYCWVGEKDAIMGSEDMVETIRQTNVFCLNGDSTKLYNTILPLPRLQKLCTQYTNVSGIPFLAIDGPMKDSHVSKWMFLRENFGVTAENNFYFYLAVLKGMSDSVLSSEEVYNIFEMIYTQWKQSTEQDEDKKRLRKLLHDYKALAVPVPVGNYAYDEVLGSRTGNVSWLIPESATWNGPPEMLWNTPIKSRFESASITMNPVLETFYRDLAGVRDYTLDDLVKEIRALKEYCLGDSKHNQERISNVTRKIYMYLPKLMKDDEDKEGLRQIFDSEALIWKLVGGKTQWYMLSDCIWSGSTEIPGKVMLSDQWGDMKEVFVDLFMVPILSFNMVYEKLKSIGASLQTEVKEAKETIEALNAFLALGDGRQSDPTYALTARVFPIRQPQGNRELVTAAVHFAIPDRHHWATTFKDKVRMLDFNLSDIQRLKPLLRWAGLESRYLSVTVKERSNIGRLGCMPLRDSRKDIQPKAHALYRIAKHFGSPRVQPGNHNLYDTFKNTSLWTAGRIFTTLELEQDGETHRFEVPDQDCGKVHIQDDGVQRGLKIYVPQDSRAQEITYLSAFQRRLLNWIMAPLCSSSSSMILDPAALSILKSILSAHRSTLESSLEEEGIGNVDFEDDFEEDADVGSTFQARNLRTGASTLHRLSISSESPQSSSDEMASGSLPQDTTASSVSSFVSSGEAHCDESLLRSRSFSSSGDAYSIPVRSHLGAYLPPLSPVEVSISDSPEVSDAEYVRILGMAVSKARVATLQGPYSLNVIDLDVSGEDDNCRIKYRTLLELTFKIGAAGELFAFVFLSRFLPNFTRGNWQSVIRRYVKVYPDYADLEPWKGKEKSDIIYKDTEGTLIQMLIENGYMESTWSDVRANFFIEVKTTTGPCQRPFYMGNEQYELMQTSSNTGPSPSRENVYILFRVFNLGKDTMDFCIFVDPEKHQQQGTLKFSPKWTVAPRSSPLAGAPLSLKV